MLFFGLIILGFIGNAFELHERSFGDKDLEPFISEQTSHIHYNKHHAGYVSKLNKIAEEMTELKELSVIDINAHPDRYPSNVVNLAAQIFNHELYWHSLIPKIDYREPTKRVIDAISMDFGTLDNFKKIFSDKAKKHFGSGWVWLSLDLHTKELVITEGHDASMLIIYYCDILNIQYMIYCVVI